MQQQAGKYTVHPSETDSSNGGGLTLAALFAMLRAHARFILICAALGGLCALTYLLINRPVYDAAATLRLDSTRAGSLGVSDPAAPALPDDTEIIKTEMGVMKSDSVALRVLNALPDDEFLKVTKLHKDATSVPGPTAVLSGRQEGVLRTFTAKVNVKQVEGTQLVNVGFMETDPRLAAVVANRLVTAYQAQSVASRDASVLQLRGSLTAQIQNLRAQVDESQKKLAAFQEANSILGTQGSSNTVTDRLKALNDRLASADADRVAKEGQYRAALRGDAATLASLFANPKLNELQSQQGLLYAKYAQLSAKFGAKYPPLVELQKQMNSVDAEIVANANAIRSRLQQEYAAADSIQKMFQREYDTQIATAFAVNRNQAEYAQLVADVTSGREAAGALERKLDQAVVDAEVSGVNVMMIDLARPPVKATGPGKTLILFSGLLIGLFGGCVAAFIFEALSDRLKRGEQIEQATGYPIFGSVPHAVALHGASRSAAQLITLISPLSAGAEAYRAIRNKVLLSSPGDAPKVLLVVSGLKLEGAENAAANTAVSLAQAGLRTLLIDADLQHPALHGIFGTGNIKGLSEFVVDGGAAPVTHPVEGLRELSLLTAGTRASVSSDELASENFRLMLQKLRNEFDYVVISGAALLASSDSLLLAKRADAVLLVVRRQVTRLGSLTRVRTMLEQIEVRVAGVLLSEDGVGGEG